jgi:hypothetical protein
MILSILDILCIALVNTGVTISAGSIISYTRRKQFESTLGSMKDLLEKELGCDVDIAVVELPDDDDEQENNKDIRH